MDTLKKLFPYAFKSTDTVKFITALIIYALIDIVCGLVIGLLLIKVFERIIKKT